MCRHQAGFKQRKIHRSIFHSEISNYALYNTWFTRRASWNMCHHNRYLHFSLSSICSSLLSELSSLFFGEYRELIKIMFHQIGNIFFYLINPHYPHRNLVSFILIITFLNRMFILMIFMSFSISAMWIKKNLRKKNLFW